MNIKLKTEKKNGNLLCVHTNGRKYDFSRFTMIEQFYYDILSGKITIKQPKDEQNEIKQEIFSLDSYDLKKQDQIDERS